MHDALTTTTFAQRLTQRVAGVVTHLIPRHRPGIQDYLLTLVLMLAALLLRLAIAPVNVGLQYVTFFPVVTLAAVAGGYRPGLFATLIGMLLGTFIFTPPYYSFSLQALHASLWPNLVFLTDGIIVSFCIEAMHAYRRQYGEELQQARQSEAQVQRLNDELNRQIEQRRQTEQELRDSEAALRGADRHKDEFLSMLAHELRNPLTPISLATHILEQPGIDAEQHRWAVATISGRVEHITRLVDDLLDVSRISRGRITLKREPLLLADLVNAAADTMRPVIAAKNHRFTQHLPEQPVTLNADPVRLTQVLTNILDNAAKYTPKGGHIEVRAEIVGEEVELVVSDDGMGMPAELIPHVFELFQQGERTLDRSQGGLGIGMSLAQRLVNLHDGRIQASSAGPGQGSQFTVWLPIDATGPVPQAAAPRPVDIPGSVRVLVVDDERLITLSLGKMLTLHGHSVAMAYSGADALLQAAEFQPRLILLDIGMPGMDGYETARRLRALPGGDAYRLIAVSGYGDAATLAQARSAGFDAHLTKPVNFQRVMAELELACAEPTARGVTTQA